MLQPTEAADIIRRAQQLLRTGVTGPHEDVANAMADMLDESLAYARLPGRVQQYPMAVKGVRLAEAILAEWGPE